MRLPLGLFALKDGAFWVVKKLETIAEIRAGNPGAYPVGPPKPRNSLVYQPRPHSHEQPEFA
jgi:hypothetical protein